MSDDTTFREEVRRCVLAGEFRRARELIEPKLEQARSTAGDDARTLVDLLLLYETAVAEAATEPSEKSLQALALCEEAIRLCEAAAVDSSLLIEALTRAATRCALEDPKRAVEFSRRAVVVAAAHPPADVDTDWLRVNVVIDLLSSEDIAGALAEVESWPFWRVDNFEMCMVAETLFRAGKLECLPLLDRILRHRDSWSGVAVGELERMAALARTWPQRE